MTDPLRSDAAAIPAPLWDREREARVEELLLGGLDHYFAGRYDLAINVWTRVLFLDRGHARARAYIERARGAVSERQRQGEELIHAGAEAFERGDPDAARRLVLSAVEHGAGNEEALALLARLDRLVAAGVPRQHHAAQSAAPAAEARHRDAAPPRPRLTLILAAGAAGAATIALALWTAGARPAGWPGTSPAPVRTVAGTAERPVPVPSGADLRLARARAQKDRGHLRGALAALDAIAPAERRRSDAERLRAEIQAALLAAGRAAAAVPVGDGARAGDTSR